MTPFPLTFEEVGHRYQWRGQDVPSVTQILKDLRLSPPYPEDRGWLAFGQAVHKCCELATWDRLHIGAAGEADRYPATDKLFWPYLDAFRQKMQEYRVIPLHSEFMVYNDLHGYAGQLDLHCKIFNGEEAIWDFKTGAPPESTALQLAGYDLALNRMLGVSATTRRRRFALRLFTDEVKETGKGKMIEFVDPAAYAAFTGACEIWKWTRRNGRKL